ncbi:ROK family protein [Saccharothrix syringae]|nr:ROK family protein [Saccharothrix syringae]
MPPTSPADVDVPITLRNLGRVRVLGALVRAHRLSRTDLVRRTGLARATVGSVTADLIRSGIVTDEGAIPGGNPGTGRPPRALALNPASAYAVGVDIGHDHIRVMLCDLVGAPVRDHVLPRAVDHDAAAVLTRTAELVDQVRREAGVPADRVLGVGVGIACPVDRDGALRAEGIMPGWVGVRPAEELHGRTGFPVSLVNDANAGVLAEHRYGAARESGDVVYLRLSTGIGAGLLCAGRLLLGSGGLAGELGHLSVEPHGLICRCGNRGCLETVANPTAITRLLTAVAGAAVSTADLVDLVRAGDRGAIRAVADAGEAVGRALAQAVTMFNPELVVIGGELVATGEVLLESVRNAVRRNAMGSHTQRLRVVPGALGDSAGARGAAALVLNDAPERLAALLAG